MLTSPAGFVMKSPSLVAWFMTYLRDKNNLLRDERFHLPTTVYSYQVPAGHPSLNSNFQLLNKTPQETMKLGGRLFSWCGDEPRKKKALLSIVSCLANRDPIAMVHERITIYNWVTYFIPLNIGNQLITTRVFSLRVGKQPL